MLARRRAVWTGAAAAAACATGRVRPVLAASGGFEFRPWPQARRRPPLVAAPLGDDGPFRLDAWRGRVVLVNFWASWCEPCIAEMASLDALAGEGALRIVGVDFKQTSEAIRAYLARHPVRYPILRDPRGEVARAWTDGVLPTTVILDASGGPRASVLGELDWTGQRARGIIRSATGPR